VDEAEEANTAMSRGYWGYFPPSRPIPVEDGIKAHTKRGRFGEHWWSQRWVKVLESLGDRARMRRGRTYARKGQVMNIDLQPGLVTARVQGSRRTPYQVRIEISPLSDGQWEQAVDALAAQAFFSAQLLGGRMPPEIEDVFQTAGASLLPDSDDVQMSCSCPDWANPCKHIAAVFYLLAETFDGDPFQTFVLRGRTREEMMGALRERRVAATAARDHLAPEETPEPLQDAVSDFWAPREDLGGVHVSIAPPTVQTALLKRLGAPAFSERPEAFHAALTLAYGSVTDKALALAFGEGRSEEP
jgi:uncharacterized Zn finger protein